MLWGLSEVKTLREVPDVTYAISTFKLSLLLQHVDARREEEDMRKANPHAKIYYKEGKRDNIFSGIKSVFIFLFPSPWVFNACPIC